MSWTALLAAAIKSLPLILQLIQQFKSSADAKVQRGLGRDEAVAEALSEFARRVGIANEVEAEAAKDHASKPDDTAFDPEFQRKDI